jgi:hypothetical protein
MNAFMLECSENITLFAQYFDAHAYASEELLCQRNTTITDKRRAGLEKLALVFDPTYHSFGA